MRIFFAVLTVFIASISNLSARAESLSAKDRYETVTQQYKGHNGLDKRQRAFRDYVAESNRNDNSAKEVADIMPAAGDKADEGKNISDIKATNKNE